ncbi:MAG: DUF222 domain-containing protein, partial [Friedmanniella sp.]
MPDHRLPQTQDASARAGDDPPLAGTGRALAAGALSRAHADAVLASVRSIPRHPDPGVRADLVGRAEAFLLDQCALFDPATVRRLGREVVHALNPGDTLAEELAAAARDELWLTVTATGRVRIRGEVDQVTGALLTTPIDAGAAPRPTRPADPDHGDAPGDGAGAAGAGSGGRDTRPAATRRAHALSEVLRLAANAAPTVHGGLSPHLLITMTLDTLRTTGVTIAAASAHDGSGEGCGEGFGA